MATNIKITALSDITSANMTYNDLVAVVDMNGTPETKKANVQIVGNLILSGAGGSYFAKAAQATNAETVSNAAQPNITSTGTLTAVTVTGNVAAGNVSGTAGVFTYVSGDGANLTNLPSGSNSAAIANGTSNVNIPALNGNINTSVAGNANILIVTGTGANVTGTFNATGNAVVGNISATNLGNVSAVNLDGNVLNILHGDGSWSADATSYGNSNVVTLMGAFGSNTITTTGVITGDGSGLSAIAGANVTGAVALATSATSANAVAGANVSGAVALATSATSANAVAYANVSGTPTLGNISTINIDGNVANVLRGDGTFSADANSSYGDSNVVTLLGAFGSNTVNTTGNVSVGNLTANPSLFVDGLNGNVLIQPNVQFNGDTFGTLNRGEWDNVNFQSTLNQAFITDNYVTQGLLSFDTYANTAAGNIARGAGYFFNSYDAIGNTATDPYVTSRVVFNAVPSGANKASTTQATHSSLTIADNIGVVTGTNLGTGYGVASYKQFQYQPSSMAFVRRNGNGEARQVTVANDETSLDFYNTQESSGPGSVQLWNYPARIGSKVDPTWIDPQNNTQGIKNGLFFNVVDENFANIEHRMYSNGDTTFNTSGGGTPITLGYNGVITGDGGGLSNIASANVSGLGNIVTTNLDGNSANYLTGTGTWAPAGGSPGGFAGTIQFNNSGTLDGDNRFQFNPTAGSGTQPQIQLDGAVGSAPGIFNLNNSVLAMNTENLSGGYAPMSFSTFNGVTGSGTGSFIEPINYYRARGTAAVPTAVDPGDMIKNERFQAYSGAGATLAYAGGMTAQAQANDGLGNIATTFSISTARPANGPNVNDKIILDTEYVQVVGNITMGAQYSSATLGRITQITQVFSSLPPSPVLGERAMITDSTAASGSVGTAVTVGGGTYCVPVYWAGSGWKMG